MTKIFIGGFSKEIKEMELVELVSPHGEVVTIKIDRDRRSGKSKGYAFLEMKDQAAAENVIKALDGMIVGKRVININIAAEKAVLPRRPGPPAYKTGTAKPSYNKTERFNKPEGFNKTENPASADKKKRPRT